ncbi:hypothetical protein C7B64_07520 [Merismopedia glauca CCAP 1448/3]|uniref:Uncharacterized protein n=2 Tax=Merismopedia TaxID=53402 RepID=A0A2T1C6A6_9CYAN|nr:hypothetical protein C7B64_07520 [Merismopedia glauca CCAP 1448/3]
MVLVSKSCKLRERRSPFFQQGRYYFEGVWGQAAQGATSQQEILRALAAHIDQKWYRDPLVLHK